MKIEYEMFSSGYCQQLEKISLNNGKMKKIKFPALFSLIKHPTKGYILFDTGYSDYFFSETKKFPFNIYAAITPVQYSSDESAINQLKNKNITKEEINYIIISHFHADHIAGLKDFPNAKFICLKKAYDAIKTKKGISALKNAFIPNLLPKDFKSRVLFLEDNNSINITDKFSPFEVGYDVFQDSSIIAVDISGHAIGQMGIFFKDLNNKQTFLCADACWSTKAYKEHIPPNSIVKILNPQQDVYLLNLNKIHNLYKKDESIKIVPSHCSEIWNEILNKGD